MIFLESFWAWGWIAAALVAYLVIPVYGWRWAFWIGAVPALFAAVLRMAIPESPRYLEAVGKTAEANALVSRMESQAGITAGTEEKEGAQTVDKTRVAFLELWSNKYLRTTIVLWIIWFGINFGYYGFVLWTPTLLLGKGFASCKKL